MDSQKAPKTMAGGKVFLIAFFTSLFVSVISIIVLFNIGIPELSFLNNRIQLDDVRNAKLEDAQNLLEAKKLLVLVAGEVENRDVPAGNIISQEPGAGTVVKKGTTIKLTVSAGIKLVEVPHLAMLPEEEAKNQLAKAGLLVGKITKAVSGSIPEGSVVSSDPGATVAIEKNQQVNLIISIGKKKVKVPSVLGKDVNDVAAYLESNGLRVGNTTKTCDIKKRFDIILNQSPSPGAMVPAGSQVNITVNAELEEPGE